VLLVRNSLAGGEYVTLRTGMIREDALLAVNLSSTWGCLRLVLLVVCGNDDLDFLSNQPGRANGSKPARGELGTPATSSIYNLQSTIYTAL
jgi:hypothetical protein